jgi:predicted phosphoribosyltransferase/alpha/beta superfamily hydrolase
MVMTMYADRVDAGRRLAELLTHHSGGRSIVLGLPRGGVPVALEVARRLHCPFDVLLVRKLGLPGQPELAMGAVGEGRVTVMNDDIVRHSGVSDHQMHDAEKRARRVIEERSTLYRCGRDAPDLHGKTAIIVDDGIATGATARAACQVARLRGARHVVLAVPVAPAGWEKDFRGIVDETVCPLTPDDFLSVGEHYGDFRQVADSEVVSAVVGSQSASCDTDVVIDADGASLRGHLTVPLGATGCVVFAHGTGSSRRSPRNVWVAARLQSRGLATLLFDLLTEGEARERHFVFDIDLLTRRLTAAVDWVRARRETSGLSVGLFGASTGAAAALAAAATKPTKVSAVVSRGGRPDLAWDHLSSVTQPVLFLVGGRDVEVLDLTRRSAERLAGPHVLSVVGGAGHLFEESGALQQVADEAGKFFEMHLH